MSDYFSTYFSILFSGVVIGIFFAFISNQTGKPTFNQSPVMWVVWGLILIFILILLYFFWIHGLNLDEREKINFHNNFFLTILTSIPLAVLIVSNYWIKQSWKSVGAALIIFILYYLVSYFIYTKISH